MRYSMRHSRIALLIALTVVVSPGLAEAKLIEVWGSGLLGGATGQGKTNRDFFKWAGGAATGVEVGARVLFLSAFIDYLRFFGGDARAHLLGLNLGGDGTIGIAPSLQLVYRLAGTYYFGSLDDADAGHDVPSRAVKTRGIGGRAGLGIRYTILEFLSVGITPELGYHYFFGGVDDDLTDVAENSHGWDMRAMAYVRFGLGF